MSLPEPWVERIFARLLATYGRDFTARWEGINMDVVRADWAHVLRGYENYPSKLIYALENLPTKPLNSVEFRILAERGPDEPVRRIEPPRGPRTPEQEAARAYAIASLKALAREKREEAQRGVSEHPREWAHRVLERVHHGERVSTYAVACAQEVANKGVHQ